MILAMLLFAVALGLSAFFSGSETGLYRVPRVRLVLDALAGKWIARGLIWLLNNPSLLVATALVGNNVANYLLSLAIVMGIRSRWGSDEPAVEMIGTLVLTPLVFVGGELLPKFLFFNAPYRLLRLAGGPFVVLAIAALPITLLVGLLGKALTWLTGETPFQVQLRMARRELQDVFHEGHQAGLLGISQRAVTQNLWNVGTRPALAFAIPLDRLPTIRRGADRTAAMTAARRQAHPIVLMRSRRGDAIEGYLLYSDLLREGTEPEHVLRPVVRLPESQRHLDVLLKLYEADCDVAVLCQTSGRAEAVVTRKQLSAPLLADRPVA